MELLVLVWTLFPEKEAESSQRTIAIDTVASANGSPNMLSILIVRIPPVLRPFISIPPFILRSDGECSDPYDGIGNNGVGTGGSLYVPREGLSRKY